MTLNVSAQYGLTPVGIVPGFGDVLSNSGTQALSAIPRDRAVLQGQLAASALSEIGETNRLQRNLDALALENQLRRKDQKRSNALRMAGALLDSVMPSADMAGVQVQDPLAFIQALRNFNQSGRQDRASQMIRSNTAAGRIAQGLG
jgi:hypothetical protein